MPNLKINITISGKWKLDGQKIKHLFKGVAWTGVATSGIWFVTHWPAPFITHIRPPLEAPECRLVAAPVGTWCLEARPRIEAHQQ